MKERKFLLMIWFSVIAFALSSCVNKAFENLGAVNQTTQSYLPIADLTPLPKPNSSIRKIDFKNFTYPWTENQADGNFTLKKGKKKRVGEDDTEATLQTIEFGDVTNDGEEEAMLSIYPWSGGNCSCEMVFIYTLRNNKPKLLWSFDTWDRADGGFKRAYAENSELVIETFGENTFENGKWKFGFPKEKPTAYCCPTAYTKIRFKWNGEKFITDGKPELFDYDWRKEMNRNR